MWPSVEIGGDKLHSESMPRTVKTKPATASSKKVRTNETSSVHLHREKTAHTYHALHVPSIHPSVRPSVRPSISATLTKRDRARET